MGRHTAVDGKTPCLQGQVYLAWVRPRDLTTGKLERSQSQVGKKLSHPFVSHPPI